MSIRDAVRDCKEAGELALLKPALTRVPIIYDMFVTHEVLRFLNGKAASPKDLLRRSADARALLERFVSGKIMSVAMNGRDKGGGAEIERLDPFEDGMWAFRVRDPKPQVRIFGGFAERDLFVAVDYRSHDSLNFNAAARAARQRWAELLGEYGPIVGESVDDYFTGRRHRLV